MNLDIFRSLSFLICFFLCLDKLFMLCNLSDLDFSVVMKFLLAGYVKHLILVNSNVKYNHVAIALFTLYKEFRHNALED